MKEIINGKLYDTEIDKVVTYATLPLRNSTSLMGAVHKTKDGEFYFKAFSPKIKNLLVLKRAMLEKANMHELAAELFGEVEETNVSSNL